MSNGFARKSGAVWLSTNCGIQFDLSRTTQFDRTVFSSGCNRIGGCGGGYSYGTGGSSSSNKSPRSYPGVPFDCQTIVATVHGSSDSGVRPRLLVNFAINSEQPPDP